MLNRDFRDLLRLFNEKRVEYLVVGGYAMSAHGHPRYTGDIDLWILTSPRTRVGSWRHCASSVSAPWACKNLTS